MVKSGSSEAIGQEPSILPFDMTWEMPVFRRIRSLAMALFGAYESTVVIQRDGQIWRSVDPEGKLTQRDRAGQRVIESGKSLWFEDVTREPDLADGVMVVGPPYLRFYAAAP